MPKRTARAAMASLCLSVSLFAARDRITEPVFESRRVVLEGHIHPKTRQAVDMGRVDGSLVLPYVTLAIQQSAAQQADLDQLLAEQQDPASPNYHQWLTPEQYAERFGASPNDISAMTSWLEGHGLSIQTVANGRQWIAFSGTASQIEQAFSLEIHHYQLNGELHYANATNPSVPAAFQDVILGLHGLTDFRLRPAVRGSSVHPLDTKATGEHEIAPDDFATIYDLTPLYQAGIEGSGQKIAVAGQTQIKTADIDSFRTYFNLPANTPQTLLVPNTKDPGLSSGDLLEADLDLEWAGATARNASITFVYSYDVMDALQYAIDQKMAPVVSISYGSCEPETAVSDELNMQSWARQGNAQGMTIFAASGDNGAADCYGGGDGSTDYKESVDVPAAIPEVTGVGGTEFNDGSGSGYWSPSDTTSHASALGYIPERAWNDSLIDDQPSASGGGVSIQFTKPSWQTGTGVPNDGARDVPDVSVAGSADHDGYEVYSNGRFEVVGGTSAGPPTFGGMAAMLNQYVVSHGLQTAPGLGNMNPRFYALAQTSGIYHDITTGNNIVVPCLGMPNCQLAPIGYTAGTGYDRVTGLGTIDAAKLFANWQPAVVTKSPVTVSLTSSAASVPFTGSTQLTATVQSSGGGAPSGTVTFSLGSETLGSAALAGSGNSATASVTVYGILLSPGSNTITAQYGGSASFDSGSATTGVTAPSVSGQAPAVGGVADGASFKQAFAPGGILSIFGTDLAPASGSATIQPLPTRMAGVSVTIGGISAPLYYVSPGQLNVQIPYEAAVNTSPTLVVNNNGVTASSSFHVSAEAPGIFTFNNGAPVPYTTAMRGQTITLYISGAGAVTPAVATGAAPAAGTAIADLPKPNGDVVVTVGNVVAPIQFAGIPWALVGVTQINYQIPESAPLGAQPVVVSIGGVLSAAATLDVTQ